LKQQWCTPSATAEFVWRMEDVLDVYCRPYDPRRPLLCMDEMGKNLVKDKHPPEDMQPGQPRREDYTYEKKGAGNVFIACEPLAGKRYLKVSKRRTKKDWAYFLKELLTEHYVQAEKVVLVMDNLNTHSPASFYEVFPPEEAKALADKLEIHYTPKHPSWLNIAEIELSLLVRQGLARNIATMQEFCEQAEQWQAMRNQSGATVRWQFTTADARIKLERLYPLYKKPSGTAP
jgi:DDE superfamily endonuclease